MFYIHELLQPSDLQPKIITFPVYFGDLTALKAVSTELGDAWVT